MLTIQTPSRESTVLSHKIKAVFIVLLVILVCCLLVRCCIYFWPDNYSYRLYNDSDDLVNTFNNNREDFEELLSILSGSDLWDHLYDLGRPYIMSTRIEHWKDYLTKEEYEIVCNFLETYGPHSMRDYYEAFYISFLCKTENASLYYTELEGDELDRYLSYIGQHREITQLDERWYLAIRQSDVTRG